MIGNASEQVSQVRRSRILESIDKSWGEFAEGDFKLQDDSQFGEKFQEKLTSEVEKDNHLSKALSITKSREQRDYVVSMHPPPPHTIHPPHQIATILEES